MSNAIRYDALLLKALAAELDSRLRGARIARAWLDKPRRVLGIELGEKRNLHTLSWNLHPAAGQVALRPGVSVERGAQLQVRPGTPLAAVSALADERVLRFELDPGAAAPGVVRALVVELIGNRWNALALSEGDVISATLLQRPDGARPLRAGVRWEPPAGARRLGVDAPVGVEPWCDVLLPLPPGERARAALAAFAYASPINVGYILGDAAAHEVGAHVLREAHARYLDVCTAAPRPCILPAGQPYAHPLGTDALPADSLLAAFARAGQQAALPALGEAALRDAARAALHERTERVRARRERLEREAADAGVEAARLRAWADVLLARLHEVPHGAAEVELADFEGGTVRIPLDAAHSAVQNAQALYERARRREGAAARVPALLERAAAELRALAAYAARLERGELAAEELARWSERALQPARSPSLPYRRYRSSGGLELRVGRSAKANDALITAQHSSPEDIWLHARDVGGAHVILRWGRKDANPPRADLVEAAVLAALHSRARSSGTVPVDWTRRKYVRKPRRAAPGLVVPERVSTIFVEPARDVEERLRVDEDEA